LKGRRKRKEGKRGREREGQKKKRGGSPTKIYMFLLPGITPPRRKGGKKKGEKKGGKREKGKEVGSSSVNNIQFVNTFIQRGAGSADRRKRRKKKKPRGGRGGKGHGGRSLWCLAEFLLLFPFSRKSSGRTRGGKGEKRGRGGRGGERKKRSGGHPRRHYLLVEPFHILEKRGDLKTNGRKKKKTGAMNVVVTFSHFLLPRGGSIKTKCGGKRGEKKGEKKRKAEGIVRSGVHPFNLSQVGGTRAIYRERKKKKKKGKNKRGEKREKVPFAVSSYSYFFFFERKFIPPAGKEEKKEKGGGH